MNKKNILLISVLLGVGFCTLSHAQSSDDAADYMRSISEQYETIQKEMWDYTSTVAHSRSARKVEKNREVLLKTISKSISEVKALSSFDLDYSLRDSVVSFLRLNYRILNNDFDKIIDMEEVAEQSYDMMEAYLLAQELANQKLELAAENMDIQYRAFADKYGVHIIENKDDKISQKLKKSSEALKYYNQVYLVFFKAYKQELYLMDALERNDINSIEQNRNALSGVSDEGMEKLTGIGHFKGDNSINASCKRMLLFYKDEAENKIPILTDFLQTTDEYNKMAELFKSKDRMLLTKDEVDKYNEAVDNYNKGVNKFNTTNNALNSKRSYNLEQWNNSVEAYMTRQVPK